MLRKAGHELVRVDAGFTTRLETRAGHYNADVSLLRRNLLPRTTLAVVAAASLLLFHTEFREQFDCYFTGQAHIVSGAWHIVALNIALFVALLIPLSFRRRAHWGQYGIVAAFFVSLFIEMYGVPLAIYFASRHFTQPVACASNVFGLSFLGVNFTMEVAMVYTSCFIAIGTVLIIVGWVTLYRNHTKVTFVTKGIYRFSRHPQYVGFMLIVIGWLIDWPTLITLVFAPILVATYLRVCLTEEKEILKAQPGYQEYRERVPMLI